MYKSRAHNEPCNGPGLGIPARHQKKRRKAREKRAAEKRCQKCAQLLGLELAHLRYHPACKPSDKLPDAERIIARKCQLCPMRMLLNTKQRAKKYCTVCAPKAQREQQRQSQIRFRESFKTSRPMQGMKPVIAYKVTAARDAANDDGKAPRLPSVVVDRSGKFCGNCLGQSWRREHGPLVDGVPTCVGCGDLYAEEPAVTSRLRGVR